LYITEKWGVEKRVSGVLSIFLFFVEEWVFDWVGEKEKEERRK
jgi:hypothetical protein